MSTQVIPAIRIDRVHSDGTVAILIRVIHKRKVIYTESLGKRIQAKEWCLTSRKVIGHSNAKLLNIAIRRRVHEIEANLMELELGGTKLSAKNAKQVILGLYKDIDFVKFCIDAIETNYGASDSKETYRTYMGEVRKLKEYSEDIAISDIGHKWLDYYKHHLITVRKNKPNTVHKAFKFLHRMLSLAVDHKHLKEHPMKGWDRGKYVQPVRSYLEPKEMALLYADFSKSVGMRKRIVHYYLFMCATGLRYQDALSFCEAEHVHGNTIVMTTRKEKVIVRLPINKPIRSLLPLPGLKMSNKAFNQHIQAIGVSIGIGVHLTAHVARHSLGATLALNNIPIKVAQRILGHRDVRSTEIYYHLRDDQVAEAMNSLNDVLNFNQSSDHIATNG